MTELSGEIPTADAQQEAAAQLFRDEYLYGRLLEWAMADASTAEQAILERADADRLREDYRSAMYDAATVETWREQADAILYAPTATEAEHVANDLHRYAQLSRLSWQLGSKNVFEAKAVADGMHQLCVERSARMRQLAQQPEARDLTRAVLAQLRGRDDPWARVSIQPLHAW